MKYGDSKFNFYFFILIYVFIYLGLHWVFVAVRGLSLGAANGAALRCSAQASQCSGFSCCGSRAGGRAGFSSCSTRARELWCAGLVAPRHVGSSQTKDQACVPCIGRLILNHWITRDVLITSFFFLDCQNNVESMVQMVYICVSRKVLLILVIHSC